MRAVDDGANVNSAALVRWHSSAADAHPAQSPASNKTAAAPIVLRDTIIIAPSFPGDDYIAKRCGEKRDYGALE